jgi:hypothetical protein
MANELVANLGPFAWARENVSGYNPADYVVQIGDFFGLALPKYADQGYTTIVQVPGGVLTTGLTITTLIVPDGKIATDYGKVVRLGITPKRLIDDESLDIDTGAATEVTADVTLKASGTLVELTATAIANAALDSLAVTNFLGLRIRRIGTASQDTAAGRVVLMGFGVLGT